MTCELIHFFLNSSIKHTYTVLVLLILSLKLKLVLADDLSSVQSAIRDTVGLLPGPQTSGRRNRQKEKRTVRSVDRPKSLVNIKNEILGVIIIKIKHTHE